MELLSFKKSNDFSVGLELEYQIINPVTGNLSSNSKELVRIVQKTDLETIIKPEITQSMLEINTSIHNSTDSLLKELIEIRLFLNEQANKLNIRFCGGGTHPFQKWVSRKIFPTTRYKEIAKRYMYLAKRATVFGQHIHIGCANPESALYLTHILARYVPQLIAMSASSPFYQGIDSGYDSTRATVFNMFPTSGTIPFLTDWEMFSAYFFKMKSYGIIQSMKDFYWDVRPKPEFGTVEFRVCDTPLTLKKAVMLAAYVQSLCCYLLREHPVEVNPDIYTLHAYNRFQAARYGFAGIIINPYSTKNCQIKQDILETMDMITPCAQDLGNIELISELRAGVLNEENDTKFLRTLLDRTHNLKEVVREQCRLWIS